MNIDDLKSTVAKKGGLAPANRFNVIFTPPSQSLLNLNVENIDIAQIYFYHMTIKFLISSMPIQENIYHSS